MRLNAKGQVTIPADLRARHGFHPGDQVEVIDTDGTLQIVRASGSDTAGQRLVERMRGRATTELTTDQLLSLLRADE
ncbi:MAG: AbrB/MazE/SpoVT family DNA-binding domain-containing protein [Micropruina sp.]